MIIMIAQLILSLSILVILHELGHFIPAKLFKTRVEKFYLFFDPWFSLLKFKKGETEYGVGWLPLGGYVKISGMIDESMDKEQMKQPPQPWEFRSKPTWQRLIIMLGGVTVNFLLGIFIFSMILWHYGEEYLPTENAIYGLQTDSLGREIGFMDGDKILKVGDLPFERFEPGWLKKDLVVNDIKTITVVRNGKEVEFEVNQNVIPSLSSYEYKDSPLIGLRFPFILNEIVEGSPAEKANLLKGDRFTSVNGKETFHIGEFAKELVQYKEQPVVLGIERGDSLIQVEVITDKEGKIGVSPVDLFTILETARQDYSFSSSLPAGFSKAYNFLADQIKAFGKIFRGDIKASDSLGGFASITSLFPTEWDTETFWRITAILSLILGLMNLLPIPALDGGHVMFLLYEIVAGRKPSDRFMEVATIVGFIVILALLLYANGLDIMRFLG